MESATTGIGAETIGVSSTQRRRTRRKQRPKAKLEPQPQRSNGHCSGGGIRLGLHKQRRLSSEVYKVCMIIVFIVAGVSLVVSTSSSSSSPLSTSSSQQQQQRQPFTPASPFDVHERVNEIQSDTYPQQLPPQQQQPPQRQRDDITGGIKNKRTIFSPSFSSPGPRPRNRLRQQQLQLEQQRQQHQLSGQNIGNYTRTYIEKHFQTNQNQTRQSSQTVESETKVTFRQDLYDPERRQSQNTPVIASGHHNLTVHNETYDAVAGEVYGARDLDDKSPLTNKTTKFTNVTYFNPTLPTLPTRRPSGGGLLRPRSTTPTPVFTSGSTRPPRPPRPGLSNGNGNGNGNGRRIDNVHPLTKLTLIEQEKAGYVPTRPGPCDQSPCYPQTGNLLIGREANLTASSTCGMHGEERYCIVSHLEDKKKCFRCDSTDRYVSNPGLSHRINNILHKFAPQNQARSWWQSENGVENVYIQLDLEAEFHFTHLIIFFKTFRPAAMLIERSTDWGRTWKVYRYFAYDCANSFPGIPLSPQTVQDVFCESRYSLLHPSTEGELIFRVIPKEFSNVTTNDPYGKEIQDLLRITNLRINFTKLHTLGDDRLDKRQEITEKYYYSIYEMVVRGSCSCYGHASRCVSRGEQLYFPNSYDKTDMVHGECECTHNTKGANCEQCEDFYHDLEWKPAFVKQTNACKRCNCHNHTNSCHFDQRVFEASGFVSGGVCDNCLHNTQGNNCEQCKDKFYLQDGRRIEDEDACVPCQCDHRGSKDEGRCVEKTDYENELRAGTCHCKQNVTGPYCDQCKKDHWNLDENNPEGCQACTCEPKGTRLEGCNMHTGLCTCKQFVTGQNCNQCFPEYYGLGTDDDFGCKPCDCDAGGAYNNNCDVQHGNCSCRPQIGERNCIAPKEGYFIPNMDHITSEAELATASEGCEVVIREPPHGGGRHATWTGIGFMRCIDEAILEFPIDNVMTSMEYDLMIRYTPQQLGTWQQVNVQVVPDVPPDPEGPCANNIPSDTPTRVLLRSSNDIIEPAHVTMYPAVCLEANKKYTVRIEVQNTDRDPLQTMLFDSVVLLPRTDLIPFFHATHANEFRKREFEHYGCREPFKVASGSFIKYEDLSPACKKILFSVGAYVFDGAYECGCNKQGSLSNICDPIGGQCKCKRNIVGRTCDRCAAGTYGFEGVDGCTPCECNPIGSLDNFCDAKTGQCQCKENTYGQHCDQCETGFWRFPYCQACICNGHADSCDPLNGTCSDCQRFTTGTACERCKEGYYGDPRLGGDLPCKLCRCPGTDPSHSFARRCALDRYTDDVICECQEGYSGPKCDMCADNYYGTPDIPGGNCTACNCNNNIDITRPGNCDTKTGQCLLCLYSTEGAQCEHCKDGYYGDATQQTCRNCICNILGTDASKGSCDKVTGQCHCLPNVEGISCDRCIDNHWKIASGEGCEPCDCYPPGTEKREGGTGEESCNSYDGQCKCKQGFGGRRCDQCEETFWGDPGLECYPCECNIIGSATLQCDRTNGSCVCEPGFGGSKCDECARGYIGNYPNCSSCGECFENWDRILGELAGKTTTVVDAAKKIKQQGVTGAYTREFEQMQTKVDEVQARLKASNISTSDLKKLDQEIEDQRMLYGNTSADLDAATDLLSNVSQRLLLTTVSVDELERKVDALQGSANSLKSKAINLQEGNIEGALNLTLDAKRRSDAAVRRAEAVSRQLSDSKRQRERIGHLRASTGPQLNETQDELNDALDKLEDSLTSIDSAFPELNQLVCDRGGNPCDSYCGGAGCGSCGGLSCNDGAVTTSENALKFAQDAYTKLKRKDADAEELLRAVMQTKEQVDDANNLAKTTFNEVDKAKNQSERIKQTLEELEGEIQEFLNTSANTPNEIRELAQEVISKNITLRPEQIDELTTGISQSMTNLRNIDDILSATRHTLHNAKNLKANAEAAATRADKVLQDAVQVRDELSKTRDAQRNAEIAIEKAREDITAADLDLKQINSETADADRKSQESLNEVSLLNDRLDRLQRKNLENERMRLQVNTESEAALKNATEVQRQASRLNDEYGTVSKSLQNKLKRFEGAKEKDEIQGRANRLASNVQEKLTELTEMEREYTEHERKTSEMLNEINRLTRAMEIHFQEIKKIEEYHRTCNA